MKLYLIRHGQSTSNIGSESSISSTKLTNVGKVQAERLGKYMCTKKIDLIICNPQFRAKETLNEIRKNCETSVVFNDSIVERNKGEFAGKPKKDFYDAIEALGVDEETFRPNGGENYEDVYNRAKKFKNELHKLVNEKNLYNVAIISHNAFLVCFILALLGKEWREAYYFGVKNTSISWFDLDENFNVKDFEINTMTHILK